MYPPLLAFHQDLAAGGIRYRLNRIAGAKLKAQSYQPPYQGAMFPWESAFTGQEVRAFLLCCCSCCLGFSQPL